MTRMHRSRLPSFCPRHRVHRLSVCVVGGCSFRQRRRRGRHARRIRTSHDHMGFGRRTAGRLPGRLAGGRHGARPGAAREVGRRGRPDGRRGLLHLAAQDDRQARVRAHRGDRRVAGPVRRVLPGGDAGVRGRGRGAVHGDLGRQVLQHACVHNPRGARHHRRHRERGRLHPVVETIKRYEGAIEITTAAGTTPDLSAYATKQYADDAIAALANLEEEEF